MNPSFAHQKFIVLVQATCVVKDIQTGQQKSALVIATAFDVQNDCLDDYEGDADALSKMAHEYVSWQFNEAPRPKWITFFNGKHI